MIKQFYFKRFNLKLVISLQSVQMLKYIVQISNSSIRPINRTLSSAITPGQSGLGSDSNEGVLHIPQSSRITGTSPSDCLVSYIRTLVKEVLHFCRDAIGIFCSRGQVQQSRLECNTKTLFVPRCTFLAAIKHMRVHMSTSICTCMLKVWMPISVFTRLLCWRYQYGVGGIICVHGCVSSSSSSSSSSKRAENID